MPTTDLHHVDTTPGCGNVFAPPAEFAGDDEGYASWIRDRFDQDFGFRQYLGLLSRALCKRSTSALQPVLDGPFAERLKLACVNLDNWLHRKTT